MTKTLFLLNDAAKIIGVKPYQLAYALSISELPEPVLRLGSEPRPMRLENGFRISDSEMKTKSQRQGPTTKDGSPSSPAHSPYQFSVRESGNIGQEVLDDGKVVAWTTDVVLAHRIARMLNANQGSKSIFKTDHKKGE